MGMIKLNPREVATKEPSIGKIIIFCEGMTEKNYFDYFAKIINDGKNKFNEIKVEVIPPAEGNARRVLNFAEKFLNEKCNTSKYQYYQKFLSFDCDAPDDIQNVINDMISSTNNYELLLTNLLFETWLLMHFEEVNFQLKKRGIFSKLAKSLGILEYNDNHKNEPGIIRKILSCGDVKKAIENAKILYEKYEDNGQTVKMNIKQMNPYTTVHKLVEDFLIAIS